MCIPSNFDDSWSLLMQLECINDKKHLNFSFVLYFMLCTAQMQIYQVGRYCKDWRFLKEIILKFLFKSTKFLELFDF